MLTVVGLWSQHSGCGPAAMLLTGGLQPFNETDPFQVCRDDSRGLVWVYCPMPPSPPSSPETYALRSAQLFASCHIVLALTQQTPLTLSMGEIAFLRAIRDAMQPEKTPPLCPTPTLAYVLITPGRPKDIKLAHFDMMTRTVLRKSRLCARGPGSKGHFFSLDSRVAFVVSSSKSSLYSLATSDLMQWLRRPRKK